MLLRVLAQDQLIAALGEFDVLEKGHAEQDLVDLQAGGDAGADIVQADLPDRHVLQTRRPAGAEAIGRLRAESAAAAEIQALCHRLGYCHAGGAGVQHEHHGFAVDLAAGNVVTEAVALKNDFAHTVLYQCVDALVGIVLPIQQVGKIRHQQGHEHQPGHRLHAGSQPALFPFFLHGCLPAAPHRCPCR